MSNLLDAKEWYEAGEQYLSDHPNDTSSSVLQGAAHDMAQGMCDCQEDVEYAADMIYEGMLGKLKRQGKSQ